MRHFAPSAAAAGIRQLPRPAPRAKSPLGAAAEIVSMAEAKPTIERPLSPHLSIYSWQINMVMSIVHRLTGAALYAGTLLLAAWLVAVASGEQAFALVNSLLAHPLGVLVLFGYSWVLLHHLLGGIRHLIWDSGRGLRIWQVNALSWLTLIGSVSLTLLMWALGLFLKGAL
jgi:succinate dehydrogenase / fumarate reductase cytochrome b subunit